MGFDGESASSEAIAFNELRLRIEVLEREVAALQRQQGTEPQVVAAAPPPPVPLQFAEALSAAVLTQPPPQPVVAPPQRPAAPKKSLENRLGSQVFNWIGIVAIFIAAAWGLQLAIENNWIGPLGRIVIGLVAGVAIVLWSEHFRRKRMAAFSYSLKAVGSGVLYLSLWAAFQIYHLLPAPVALAAMILVTAWNAFMAWSQDAELLAAYALAGGFLTPILLSTGGNHETFLFLYLLAIDLATVALLRAKPWLRLLFGTVPITIAFFIGWYSKFFEPSELLATAIFLLLFGLTFASVSIGQRAKADLVAPPRPPLEAFLSGIFLPLVNAAFVALGFYSILQDSGHHAALPFLMVALASAYLALMRLPQSRVASAIHLSLAIVFLTIAIPLKASGHFLTVAWLVEGVALFWIALRLAAAPVDPDEMPDALSPESVLRWLAASSLALGFLALLFTSYWFDPWIGGSFFNHDLGTALVGIAAFAVVAWLAAHAKGRESAVTSPALVKLSLAAINIIAILLTLREITGSVSRYFAGRPFFHADFGTALVGLAVLAAAAWAELQLSRQPEAPSRHSNLLPLLSILAIDIVAALLSGRELLFSILEGATRHAFFNPDFATALTGIAILAVATAVTLRLAKPNEPTAPNHPWLQLTGASIIAINLLALLCGVREISSLWSYSLGNPTGDLKQALAVSAFLMLYSAMLLAVGFWKRTAFIRWQGLILLVFTIGKTFLYDTSSLTQAYRVLSFLGLGVLLMAVSYAYQKDWLGLREAKPAPPLETE